MDLIKYWVGFRLKKNQWVIYSLDAYAIWFLSNYRLETEVYDAYVDARIVGMNHGAAVEVALKFL